MNTTEYLSQLGISMEQARSFVTANLGKPATIYNVAKQFKIDSQMLADIVAPQFPGLTAAQVEAFFNKQGLYGNGLNVFEIDTNTQSLLWHGATELAPMYAFNQNSGILSTQSLRDTVIAKVGTAKYIKAFSPSDLPGSADGTLSTTDLGFSHLGEIEATWQNFESLYYGSMINFSKAVSQSEVTALLNFVDANKDTLPNESREIVSQVYAQLIEIFKDPTDSDDPSAISDSEIATYIVEYVVNAVRLLGTPYHDSLFHEISIL